MARYIVTVIDADTRELIEQSEEPVELRYLTAEGRDVAEAAFWILNARLREATTTDRKVPLAFDRCECGAPRRPDGTFACSKR